MNITIKGNLVSISIPANEGQPSNIQLPPGYSFEKIHINRLLNVTSLITGFKILEGEIYTFPPVNSKSPCYVQPVVGDTSKLSEIKFFIEKFGQIPDEYYFEKTFKPIAVMGNDGKKYNVIPSDQFKG